MLFKPKSFRAFLRAVHPKKVELRGFLSFLILAREKGSPLKPSSLEYRKTVETVAHQGISQAELGSFSSVEIKPIVISLSDASLQNLEPLRTQPTMKQIKNPPSLTTFIYDIRGPIMDKAKQMEAEGRRLIKLNIGNLAVFGFDPPEEVMRDMIYNLPNSAGYSDSKGMFAARKAVMHYTQDKQIEGVTLEDIYLGNGASDLITMATNALLDEGDELLVPTPDYPLWTAVTSLAGAKPVHYLCDEEKRLDSQYRRHPCQSGSAHQRHRRHQPKQPHRRSLSQFRAP